MLRHWSDEHSGVWLASEAPEVATKVAIGTAEKLGHVVLARIRNDRVQFYALPVNQSR